MDFTKSWVISTNHNNKFDIALYPFREMMEENFLLFDNRFLSSPDEERLYNRLFKEIDFNSKPYKVSLLAKLLIQVLKKVEADSSITINKNSSKPTAQTALIKSLIQSGLGLSLMERIKTDVLPLIHSHPLTAMIADYNGYSLDYCIISNADISRNWVANDPSYSKIVYLTPSARPIGQLRSYGIPDERIFFTGLPFPLKLLGDENLDILKNDVGQRLHYLDPFNLFWPLHGRNVKFFLGEEACAFREDRVLTINFVVRKNGSNTATALKLATQLKDKIKERKLRLILSIQNNTQTHHDLCAGLTHLGFSEEDISIIYHEDFTSYFGLFTDSLRKTDILWTAPTELSFYGGMALPIVMTHPETEEELYNKKWLVETQIGIEEQEVEGIEKWLFEKLYKGHLAEAAWGGFLNSRKYGTYKVLEILRTGTMIRDNSPLKR